MGRAQPRRAGLRWVAALGGGAWIAAAVAPSLDAGAAVPALAAEPTEAVEALPAAAAVRHWTSALAAEGGRLPPDFVAAVTALHPYALGRWSETFHAEVVGVGGSVHLAGTFEVAATGLAETHLRMSPAGSLGAPEVWAWRRLTRRVAEAAQRSVDGQVTTPAAVAAAVGQGLTDPVQCHRHLDALGRSTAPGVGALVLDARDRVPPACVPAAIAVLAGAPPSAEGRPAAEAWVRTAWATATPAGRASLLRVLEGLPDLPADLALLVEDAAIDARVAAEAEAEAARRQASAPVMCADGRVDPTCRCGDELAACCVHHGGVARCLPPPPQ